MGRNGVGKARRIVDIVQRGQHLRRDLFVQFDIAFKLIDRRTDQHFLFALFDFRRDQVFRLRGKMVAIIRQGSDMRALQAFD